MPTARELLEQADALMKRNRLAVPAHEDGIPMLTESVPGPPASGTETAAFARKPYHDLDDVPLLTDAVEEIEAPSILEEPLDIEEPPDFDDPAVWTDTLTGAHSILGNHRIHLPAPVPASELGSARPAQAQASFPSGVVERSAEWDDAVAPYVESIEVEAPAAPLEELGAERIADVPAGSHVASAAAFDDRDFDALPRADDPQAPPVPVDGAPASAGPMDAPRDEPTVIAATPFEFTPGETTGPQAHRGHADATSAAALEPYDTGAEATLPGLAVRPVPPAAPAAPTEDDARWSALAEEIRMQVLQRIDLFTDTGLREQLAARLQPIVDRASADLVATINQHVGVLLRAYVAEAIEREIERWRADRP